MNAATAPDYVALTALALQDFRNYAILNAAFEAALVAFVGPNGAGKTNLLEAISLLSPGRGLRRASFDEIGRLAAERGWGVAATVSRNGAEIRIRTDLEEGPAGEGRSRRIRIDGAPAPAAEALLDYLRVLWLTPAMDSLFAGPAAERRRFLDRLVLTIDAAHARRARDLERLLAQRNRLLGESADPNWLDAVEVQLAEKAVAVALARAETAALLSSRMAGEAQRGSEFPAGRISLLGEFDRAISGRRAAEAELWYRGVLAQARESDRAAGRTLAGPHRSDVEVVLAAKAMPAALSSTGEQKTLLIGLILAHAELVSEMSGMKPILLLDEVAAHLDPDRRAALFARLQALGCQAFMTGTDPGLFVGLPGDAARYRVVAGQLNRGD
jgi:DNA replication and repair protein RecF